MAGPIRLEKKYKLLNKTEDGLLKHPSTGYGWREDIVDQVFDSEDDAMTFCLRMDLYNVYIVPYISPVWFE